MLSSPDGFWIETIQDVTASNPSRSRIFILHNVLTARYACAHQAARGITHTLQGLICQAHVLSASKSSGLRLNLFSPHEPLHHRASAPCFIEPLHHRASAPSCRPTSVSRSISQGDRAHQKSGGYQGDGEGTHHPIRREKSGGVDDQDEYCGMD